MNEQSLSIKRHSAILHIVIGEINLRRSVVVILSDSGEQRDNLSLHSPARYLYRQYS